MHINQLVQPQTDNPDKHTHGRHDATVKGRWRQKLAKRTGHQTSDVHRLELPTRNPTTNKKNSNGSDEQKTLPQPSDTEPQNLPAEEEEEVPPGHEEDSDRLPQDERDESLEARFQRKSHPEMLYGPDLGAPKAVLVRSYVIYHNCGGYGHDALTRNVASATHANKITYGWDESGAGDAHSTKTAGTEKE